MAEASSQELSPGLQLLQLLGLSSLALLAPLIRELVGILAASAFESISDSACG